MNPRQLVTLLILSVLGVGLTGCGKTSDQDLAEKKAKELRKGDFQPRPSKSY